MTPTSINLTSNDIHRENVIFKTCEKIVLLFCGLPGAGKSTLARHFIAERSRVSSSSSTCVALIEYDDVQDSLLINNNQQCRRDQEKEESKELEYVLEAWRASRAAALQTLSEQLDNSTTKFILLDDNFQLTSMRKQVFQACQSHVTNTFNCDTNTKSNHTKNDSVSRTIYFGLIWMDTPVDVCLQRNQHRKLQRRVPDLVIQNMKHKFEAPGGKSFLWEQSFLRLDGTASHSTHLEQLLSFTSSLERLTLIPPRVDPGIEEARLATARLETLASRAHQVDQYLRCCVQAVARHHKQCAGAANQCRKQLLSDFKQKHELVVIEALEQAFLDQMRKIAFSSQVDWEAFQPILHRDLLVKQSDFWNGCML